MRMVHQVVGDGIGKSVDPGMGSGRVSRIARWGWVREEYPGFIPYRVIPCRVIPCRRALSLSDSFHPQIPSIISFMPQAAVSVVSQADVSVVSQADVSVVSQADVSVVSQADVSVVCSGVSESVLCSAIPKG